MVPIIDIAPILQGEGSTANVASALHNACTTHGFFYIQGHGISEDLQDRLEKLSRRFFALDMVDKMQIRMQLGGKAWRGFFPVGDELTSGIPDLKEGLYFGTELGQDDARVVAGWPMHGKNLFPPQLPELKQVVLEYMEALTRLGHHLMAGIALSLGLEPSYFRNQLTADPLRLFRIFHYPPPPEEAKGSHQWGVGEHTDYGLLTILKQDEIGGLQIKSLTGWLDAPVIPNTFVCNIGDMLDRLTRGYYRSTPHRVRNSSAKGRLSFPFFFDPGFEAEIHPLPLSTSSIESIERWDGASLQAFEGTYGEYILAKVARVFPDL